MTQMERRNYLIRYLLAEQSEYKNISIPENEAYVPEEIRKKSICINEDIGDILSKI